MSSRTMIRLAAIAALAFPVAACTQDAPPAPTQPDVPDLRREQISQDVARKLEALRESHMAYQSFDAAKSAGYDIEVTPCMVMRPQGGMGYHYGKGTLIDGTPDETAPEVLLYEPVKGGGKRLVGVEFIVPFDQWQGSEPPVLFGRQMSANQTFKVWALHAWLFKKNPKGVFTDWNPTVNC